MQHLISNLIGKTRRKQLGGKNYLVVPVSMIVPGVLNGNRGPILYTADEIRKSVDAWNGMPITINHPNKPLSARTPEILEEQGIGMVLHSEVSDTGTLKGEAWLDIENANRLFPGLIEDAENGNKIELSTGLGLNTVKAPANSSFNGNTYNNIAKDFTPDHLAILKDQIGACSLADGCGVNNKAAQSHEETHSQLAAELTNKFGNISEGDSDTWITEVFDTYIIYRQGKKLYKLGYSKSASGVSLKDSPVEVTRKVSFITQNSGEAKVTESTIDREKAIAGLIQNCSCWKAEDSDILNTMNDDQLIRLGEEASKTIANRKAIENAKNEEAEEEEEEEEEEETNNPKKKEKDKEEEKAMNAAGQGMGEVLTEEQWISSAPPSVQNTFKFAQGIEARERKSLVDKIVANASSEQKESLETIYNSMATDQLAVLVSAIPEESTPVAKPNYAGAATPTPTQNSQSPLVPLQVPVMSFDTVSE